MTARFTLESNREYWEQPDTVSIVDKNLHALEVRFVSKFLSADHVMADIGCGDGSATAQYARLVRHCFGIERSAFLRHRARDATREAGLSNITIREGDVLDLSGHRETFDVVVTQRVLINLPSWELQAQAIDNIHQSLRPGGLYVLIENTHDGNDIMNEYRQAVGLPPIPIHWHNELLDFETFTRHIASKFQVIERRGFDLYYLLTRVYVQMFASFTGSGKDAKADPIFAMADQAARVLFERIGDRVVFADNPVFGPIQGMALQKL